MTVVKGEDTERCGFSWVELNPNFRGGGGGKRNNKGMNRRFSKNREALRVRNDWIMRECSSRSEVTVDVSERTTDARKDSKI